MFYVFFFRCVEGLQETVGQIQGWSRKPFPAGPVSASLNSVHRFPPTARLVHPSKLTLAAALTLIYLLRRARTAFVPCASSPSSSSAPVAWPSWKPRGSSRQIPAFERSGGCTSRGLFGGGDVSVLALSLFAVLCDKR